MGDSASIITQVSRDEEQNYVFPNTDSSPAEVTKKPRGRGLCLKSLLCCFGLHNNHNNNNNNNNAHTPGQPSPCSEENGSIKQVTEKYLLPDTWSQDTNKLCVVIDLDETLVHSSFKPICNADFVVPVEIDGTIHEVYVLKRPNVDEFLQKMGEWFECILFTASLAKYADIVADLLDKWKVFRSSLSLCRLPVPYADPVADLLDKWKVFRARLFRESCVFHRGNYVKDLSRLGRELRQVVIVDNSPASYIFHPDNAIPVMSWFDDMDDTELLDLLPVFETLSKVDDVYSVLNKLNLDNRKNVPNECGDSSENT